jgi:uncharacterized membrane protein (UPF0127 family)
MKRHIQKYKKEYTYGSLAVLIGIIIFGIWFGISRYLVSRLTGDYPGTSSNNSQLDQAAQFQQQLLDHNQQTSENIQTDTKNSAVTTPTIRIGSTILKLEIADTDAERVQGLSDRASLPQDTGLLFVFDYPSYYGFWMKDMHFSIDMIWLDKDLKVVGLKEQATPESYPQTFTPEKPALYVLETNVGFIEGNNIKIGSQFYTSNL